jgi:acetylornithine deacetylase
MKTNEATTILEQLATIPSVSGSERAVGEKIASLLQSIGCQVQCMEVDKAGFNVVGTVGTPNVCFASHMDTVPGGKPFQKTATAFFGRGVCDAKASIAAMIAAAKKAIQCGQTNFCLAFTVGEETTFRGATKLVTELPSMPFTVVGEPTSCALVNGQFGCSVFTITAKGKSAHSSKPLEGINAIDILIEALTKMKAMPCFGQTFFSICEIIGGIADNIIPDSASATVTFRTDPKDTTDYAGEMEKITKNSIKVTKGLSLDGVFTAIPKELDFLKETATNVTYVSELSLYKNGVILGPGNIKVAHSDSEIIRLYEVMQASKIYEQIIENFQP